MNKEDFLTRADKNPIARQQIEKLFEQIEAIDYRPEAWLEQCRENNLQPNISKSTLAYNLIKWLTAIKKSDKEQYVRVINLWIDILPGRLDCIEQFINNVEQFANHEDVPADLYQRLCNADFVKEDDSDEKVLEDGRKKLKGEITEILNFTFANYFKSDVYLKTWGDTRFAEDHKQEGWDLKTSSTGLDYIVWQTKYVGPNTKLDKLETATGALRDERCKQVIIFTTARRNPFSGRDQIASKYRKWAQPNEHGEPSKFRILDFDDIDSIINNDVNRRERFWHEVKQDLSLALTWTK